MVICFQLEFKKQKNAKKKGILYAWVASLVALRLPGENQETFYNKKSNKPLLSKTLPSIESIVFVFLKSEGGFLSVLGSEPRKKRLNYSNFKEKAKREDWNKNFIKNIQCISKSIFLHNLRKFWRKTKLVSLQHGH